MNLIPAAEENQQRLAWVARPSPLAPYPLRRTEVGMLLLRLPRPWSDPSPSHEIAARSWLRQIAVLRRGQISLPGVQMVMRRERMIEGYWC